METVFPFFRFKYLEHQCLTGVAVTAAREAAIPPADQSYTIDSEKSYGGPGSEAGPSTPASVLWESTSRKRKECVHSDPDVELAKKQRVIPNSMSWIFEDVVGAVEEKGSIMVELGWASSMVLLRSMNRAGLEACEALVVDKLGWDTWVEELKTFTEGRLYLAKKSCMTPTKRSGRWAFKKPLSVKVVGGRVYVEVDWENTHENLISIDFGGLEACERPVIAKIGNERWEKELRRSQAGCMYLERKVREI